MSCNVLGGKLKQDLLVPNSVECFTYIKEYGQFPFVFDNFGLLDVFGGCDDVFFCGSGCSEVCLLIGQYAVIFKVVYESVIDDAFVYFADV